MLQVDELIQPGTKPLASLACRSDALISKNVVAVTEKVVPAPSLSAANRGLFGPIKGEWARRSIIEHVTSPYKGNAENVRSHKPASYLLAPA